MRGTPIWLHSALLISSVRESLLPSLMTVGVLILSRVKVTDIPGYDRLVKLGTERKGAILFDVGCCFGTDIRKMAADGWPADSILGTDIEPKFWELGHRLFCSTADTFPAVFLPGDIFDLTHLDPVSAEDRTLLHRGPTPMPPLRSLTSLSPLRGYVAAIHAGAFFHLFSEER
ncbi:hypothetical protein GSI_03135 [Ganoderma sinense ZZ0214-1]|uniref:Methyltransferase domain-containing protein n=1 Tax=Ganoderma sinense ZZ0214-1 TaxID=1077348 RepID=A0A2G8SKS7_9APHY|nr:hypothetical protein GSI_03135 [Ganoderma sinense ZZ0214-1]